jgi:FkbM family methyltransferase
VVMEKHICSLLLCWHFLARQVSSVGLSFPVRVLLAGGEEQSVDVVIEDRRNPIKQIRAFCSKHRILGDTCRLAGAYTLQHYRSNGIDVTAPVGSYIDDTVVVVEGELTFQSSHTWGHIDVAVNLNELSDIQQSVVIPLTSWRDSSLDINVQHHCTLLGLNGKQCGELHLELDNYYTCLHYRDGGASLQNLFLGTHYNDDVGLMYVFYDVTEPGSGSGARYTFASAPYLHALYADRFCRDKQLTRPQCAEFCAIVRQAALAFDPSIPDDMFTVVYLNAALNSIVQQHIADSRSSTNDSESGPSDAFVDMDYIEIGTSNFNTVSQMLFVNDPASLRGLAVEPSAEYLAQLPVRAGITKVNAAIVAESEMSNKGAAGDMQFELFYIPEAVLEEMGLPFYLKGCNSIGDYHPLQVAGGYTQYVEVVKVPALTIRQLLTEHRVRRIRLLKIDAEGYDITILQELYMYLVAHSDPTLYPERIFFESNLAEQAEAVHELVANYVSLGYTVVYKEEDTILERVQI